MFPVFFHYMNCIGQYLDVWIILNNSSFVLVYFFQALKISPVLADYCLRIKM